jgi:hypothetical protein
VHAATEAQAGIDMLLASRSFASDMEVNVGERIFVAGYSQGGHGAMALHQVIQERPTDDLWVTASAPMSGPYSISGVMRDLILSDEEYDFAAYIVYLVLGWQEIYGDFYDNIDAVFATPYLAKIKSFQAGAIGLFALNDFLVTELKLREGKTLPKLIFNAAYLIAIRDSLDHPVNVAFRENDTYKWVPDAPMRLFYCEGDEQVPFKNALVAESSMHANGAKDVEAVLLDKNANHAACGILAALSSLVFFNSFESTTADQWTEISEEVVQVYPNPAVESVMINSKVDNEKFALSISNLQGKPFYHQEKVVAPHSISVKHWPSGIYIIYIQKNGSTWQKKLIIQ